VPALSAGVQAAEPADRVIRIVVIGDSLTAGFGIPQDAAFPVQLERALSKRGHKVDVINASVSGDTTAAALTRLDWALPEGVDAAIVELGANDGLRGQPPEQAKANLDEIMKRLRARDLEILVAGMPGPRNWGPDYAEAFGAMYPELAGRYGAILYPFFLEGVALDPALNLPDGLHPNPKGVAKIVSGILPDVEMLIDRVKARRSATLR